MCNKVLKPRIYQAFYKRIRIKWISKAMAIIFQGIIKTKYAISTLFYKHWKTSSTFSYSYEELIEELSSIRKKPQMSVQKVVNLERKMDLSIIVPAYNVEDYIIRCLNSILKQQTDYTYEVIIINDGSTDSTRDKIVTTIETYRNATLIDEENGGLSKARNTGLNSAVGKYIMFVDSDDFLIDGAVDRMMRAIVESDSDIVCCGHEKFTEKGVFGSVEYKDFVTTDTNEMLKCEGVAWGKIYRASCFNGVRFPEGACFEDTIVHMILYRRCKKMTTIKGVCYRYLIRDNSITNAKKNQERMVDSYWIVEEILDMLKTLSIPNDENLYRFLLYHFGVITYLRVSNISEEALKIVFQLSCIILDSLRADLNQIKIEDKTLQQQAYAFESRNYKLYKAIASYAVWDE